MRLGAQASVFSRSFLLQPRQIDNVYRWVRMDFGVRCLHALRNRSMLSWKAQKAARCSTLSIDQPGEHSRIASVRRWALSEVVARLGEAAPGQA